MLTQNRKDNADNMNL